MIELTNEEMVRLAQIRGGCTCFLSAPCSRCIDAPSVGEMYQIGIAPSRLVASDLVGHCKEIKILESDGRVGPLLVRLCELITMETGYQSLPRAGRLIGDAAIDFTIKAHSEQKGT